MLSRTRLAALAAPFALALALAAPAGAQTTSAVTCPASFDVLHNDRIGSLQLPAGPYTITVLDGNTLSCTDASELFEQFLEDFDGRLQRPWVLNASTATFTRGRGSTVGFRVAQSGPTPPTPPSNRVCPSYFTVLHNDHIGAFSIPRGRYRVTLLSLGHISCSQASSLLARFLQDWDGILPRPWFLDPTTGSFMRGNRNVGFRIKPWTGPVPSGGGGGTHPSDGSRCPGTFRVLNNDRIGRLRLPRGPYIVTRLRGARISCRQASSLFADFLQDFDGVLPRPWRLNTRTATFRQGSSRNGFRVKPARP
jgi:hypothetical protein